MGAGMEVSGHQAELMISGFCYIDGRDCAQAFRLALEKDFKGAEVFNIGEWS